MDEEADMTTPTEDFNSRLKVLKDLAAPIFARVREHRERPEALDNLKQSLNHSTTFLGKSRDYIIPSVESKPEVPSDDENSEPAKEKSEKTEKAGEDGLFKEKELDQLEKKISEVEKWRDEKVAEQDKIALSEMPKLTVSMINSKIGDLESEVQFLIQKAKMKKAELDRAKRKAEEEEAKAEAARKKAERKAKKKAEKEANNTEASDEETVEEELPTETPPTGDGDKLEEPTEEKPESTIDEPTESVSEDTSKESDVESEHIEL